MSEIMEVMNMNEELMAKLHRLAAEIDKQKGIAPYEGVLKEHIYGGCYKEVGSPHTSIEHVYTPSSTEFPVIDMPQTVRVPPGPDQETPQEKPHLRGNTLVVGGLELGFMRTVRVPQGKVNRLPAGLGSFPLYAVKDYRQGAPAGWSEDSFFMPMYNHEALWINFSRRGGWSNPHAVKIGAGNINAVSGEQLEERLTDKQDYLVVPPQPWLDGWKSLDGKVYQFVAAALGSGETVEGQLTGKESVGGIQILAYAPKKDAKLVMESRPHEYIESGSWGVLHHDLISPRVFGCMANVAPTQMGLGKGGEIIQKIYDDPHGLTVWLEQPISKTTLYLVSSADFRQITGREPPVSPITIQTYQQLGLPWFGLFDQAKKDAPGSKVFDKLKPVGE